MYTSEKINIAFLLRHINEEEIMSFYLGIPVQYDHLVRNPLRADKKPTAGFYWRNHRLYFGDFSTKVKVDFLNVVMLKYPELTGYNDACRKVYADFLGRKIQSVAKEPFVREPKAKTQLRIKAREWTVHDLAYWSWIGVSKSTLIKYDVRPISHYWINGECLKVTERCFAYHLGEYDYKLYFVDRPKGRRFLQNNANVLQGVQQLPEFTRRIFINKSYKDTLASYELGQYSVNGVNENQLLTQDEVTMLKLRCHYLYSIYDWDYTGIKMANLHKRLYGIEPLFYTPSRLTYYKRDVWDALPKLNAKDTSDNIGKFGKDSFLVILKHLEDYENEHEEMELEKRLHEAEYQSSEDEFDDITRQDIPFW